MPEGVETEFVEKRRHRDMGVVRDGVAQRERPVRCQLQHKTLGQWRDCVVLVFRLRGFAADGDNGDMWGARCCGRS